MSDPSPSTSPNEQARPDGASVPSIADALRLVLSLTPDQEGEAESMGGDPPCWAHLFEDDEPPTTR
jgi:hypothetical protein